MQRSLTFHLTDEDITDARHYGFGNELLYLLSNRTGTLWHLIGAGTALEIMAPHRSAQFLAEVDGIWQPFTGGKIAAGKVRVDIGPAEAPILTPEIPHSGIAHLALRFFEARAAETKVSEGFTAPG